MFVVIGTTRRTNIGTTLRCAVAFGCEAVIVVGDANYGTHGAHGSQTRIKVIHFYHWNDFQSFAVENSLHVYGIVNEDCFLSSLSSQVTSITSTQFPTDKKIAFVVGNKHGILTQEQLLVCNSLVTVPFCGGTQFASQVHIDLKLSICLHHCASSRQLIEGEFVGEKYVLSESKPISERFESKSIENFESFPPDSDVSLSDFSLFSASYGDSGSNEQSDY